jgi:hypothetical protein
MLKFLESGSMNRVNIPQMGFDGLDLFLGGRGGFWGLDFPVGGDEELLLHYLRGGAGPFVNLLTYVDLGVGWSLVPVGFEDEDEGLLAKVLVEEEFKKRDFYNTMVQFATYYYVLGRACIIKTYNREGSFYLNLAGGITGLDCVNPLTLDKGSLEAVMRDSSGWVEYVQLQRDGEVSFSQDRVFYRTNNNLSRRSVLGNSPLQGCLSDLRLINRFSVYREQLARKYANLYRVVEIDAQRLKEDTGVLGEAIFTKPGGAQDYLDETASFYREQEEKGSTVATYNWQQIKEASYAGKEVKLNDLETQTLRSIAFKLDIPLDLLMYVQVANRSVMEVLADIFVNKQEKGARNHIYTPIIEEVIQEILTQNNIKGHFTIEYNPFLSKNLLEAAQIIRDIWPTGSITREEIRDRIGLPTQENTINNLDEIKNILLKNGIIQNL